MTATTVLQTRATLATNMQTDKIQGIVEKLRALPPERVDQVADFVDFLAQRSRTARPKRRGPLNFPVISVGEWPEDLGLRREDIYGED